MIALCKNFESHQSIYKYIKTLDWLGEVRLRVYETNENTKTQLTNILIQSNDLVLVVDPETIKNSGKLMQEAYRASKNVPIFNWNMNKINENERC